MNPVIIVGAGWAGLAAAVELARRDIPVQILEAATVAGGRARSFAHDGLITDNGQHLMLGAYDQTLQLLTDVGVDAATVLRRVPLHLQSYDLAGRSYNVQAPKLPAPLHLAWAMLRAQGFNFAERRAMLQASLHMRATHFSLVADMTVTEWLATLKQPKSVVEKWWEPLCLAALTTPIQKASTKIFLRVLRDAFAQHRAASDLLYFRVPLADVLPQPAMNCIEARGGQIHLGCRVESVFSEPGIVRIKTIDGREWLGSHLILATTSLQARRLLQPYYQDGLETLLSQLAAHLYAPICTTYVQLAAPVNLPQPMVGMLGTLAQWVFDLGYSGQPRRIAVVVSGEGKHMALAIPQYEEKILGELSRVFPHWPAVMDVTTIREKRAVLSMRVDIDRLRPNNETPLPRIWLAGDYTDTCYPSTLEGAVRSGRSAAALVQRFFEREGQSL